MWNPQLGWENVHPKNLLPSLFVLETAGCTSEIRLTTRRCRTTPQSISYLRRKASLGRKIRTVTGRIDATLRLKLGNEQDGKGINFQHPASTLSLSIRLQTEDHFSYPYLAPALEQTVSLSSSFLVSKSLLKISTKKKSSLYLLSSTSSSVVIRHPFFC